MVSVSRTTTGAVIRLPLTNVPFELLRSTRMNLWSFVTASAQALSGHAHIRSVSSVIAIIASSSWVCAGWRAGRGRTVTAAGSGGAGLRGGGAVQHAATTQTAHRRIHRAWGTPTKM